MKGSKQERAPGVWRLRIFTHNDPDTGRPHQVTRTFHGTARQADTALAHFLSEVLSGRARIARSVTLAEYLPRWLEHIAATRSPTTVRGYKFKIERINKELGSVRLDQLTGQHLDRAYRTWLNEGLDPSTVHHLHRVLSAALRQAVKWDLLPYAPTAKATPPTRRFHPKEIPTPSVVQKLIATAEEQGQPLLATAIAVVSTTGLRRGELAGLRWDDIDLVGRKLHVRRAIKNDVDGRWMVGETKTHQTRRISLDAFTIEALRQHRARVESAAADAGVAIIQDAYAITPDPTGRTAIRPDALSGGFGRLCRSADIRDVSLHTLRHFSASLLVASGRDIRTIAGRLGHSDASTTLRVYAHMVEGRDQDAADYLGNLMAAAKVSSLALDAPRSES